MAGFVSNAKIHNRNFLSRFFNRGHTIFSILFMCELVQLVYFALSIHESLGVNTMLTMFAPAFPANGEDGRD